MVGIGVRPPEFESSEAKTGRATVENRNKAARRMRNSLDELCNQL